VRLVHAASLDRNVSAIGFGCASLGSRVSETDGRRAFDQAFDLGVSWYDVAPPYGDGQAEILLGEFLKGRRDKVVVCTKFGIARPNISLPKRLLRPLARLSVGTFPFLRSVVSRARSRGERSPVDPTQIEASLKTSLKLLRTDYVDVLAFHEPTPQEAADGGTFEVLAELKRKGLIRAISIAGAPPSVEAAAAANRLIDFAQFPDDPLSNASRILRSRISLPDLPVFVTHGVFARETLRCLSQLPSIQQHQIEILAKKFNLDPKAKLEDSLVTFAFSNNPHGVVVMSMFSQEHILRNCKLAARTPSREFVEELKRILTPGAP